MTVLEDKLAGWTGPSSTTEQEKQERTERMIREAVNAHPAFADMSRSVYAKGSYANNTNVRSDSDVDIAVECEEVTYWGEHVAGAHPAGSSPYAGDWTPSKLRRELVAALEAKFPNAVDSSGTTAIRVNSSSARVEADVVPCFEFKYYFADHTFRKGAKVFKNSGDPVVNYSALQLSNGRAKNNDTNQKFKKTVRILKRVENAMVSGGRHREVPSFFVECLVFNCPNWMFAQDTWTAVVTSVIAHIFNELEGDEPSEENNRWLEVNKAKFLFGGAQKWTRKDARDFALAAWSYLDLGDA